MSTQSKRPGRATRDIHEAIRADAERLRAARRSGMREGEDFPELNALLFACSNAVAAAVPQSIVFEGRTYFVQCQLMMSLAVFAGPGDSEPLARALNISTEDYGHAPGH